MGAIVSFLTRVLGQKFVDEVSPRMRVHRQALLLRSDQGHRLDGLKEFPGLNGFGNVGVHASLQATLAIAFHGVGSHGDDGHMESRGFLVAICIEHSL